MKKFIAVVVLGLSAGYFGAMIAESDHQERHIQQIESRYLDGEEEHSPGQDDPEAGR